MKHKTEFWLRLFADVVALGTVPVAAIGLVVAYWWLGLSTLSDALATAILLGSVGEGFAAIIWLNVG